MLEWIALLGSAYIFYKVGETDYGKGWLLALFSIVLSIFFALLIRLPFVPIVIGQVVLFAGATAYHMTRKP